MDKKQSIDKERWLICLRCMGKNQLLRKAFDRHIQDGSKWFNLGMKILNGVMDKDLLGGISQKEDISLICKNCSYALEHTVIEQGETNAERNAGKETGQD